MVKMAFLEELLFELGEGPGEKKRLKPSGLWERGGIIWGRGRSREPWWEDLGGAEWEAQEMTA